ncbi:MAG: chemotaxis protein CheW [Gemmatimonadales bacterium]
MLIFRVGQLACATEAETVREILPRLEATRIPGAPPTVAGLVNVRGTLVTAVDGWRTLGQPAPEQGVGSIVLLEVGGGRGGGGPAGQAIDGAAAGRLVGLVVDEVLDLLVVSAAALEPRQALPGVDPTLVRAVGRRAGQLFLVLNTDELLAPILS